MVKDGQKSVYVVAEWPLVWELNLGRPHLMQSWLSGRLFFQISNFDSWLAYRALAAILIDWFSVLDFPVFGQKMMGSLRGHSITMHGHKFVLF